VVELNRAIALAMTEGSEAGIAAIERIEADPALARYSLLPAALGHLWLETGDAERAAQYYREALARPCSAPERRFLERQLTNRRVIIMLTNVGNSKRVEISTAINNILDGKPFAYPKRAGAVELEKVYRSSGIDRVLKTYRSLKQNSTEDYDLSEAELNILGYKILYGDRKPPDAIKVFTLTTEEYPSSSNAFDSLADAYQVSGDAKAAKTTYEKALALDPTNEHSRTALMQIR